MRYCHFFKSTCDIGTPVKGPMTGADYYGVVHAGVAAPSLGA